MVVRQVFLLITAAAARRAPGPLDSKCNSPSFLMVNGAWGVGVPTPSVSLARAYTLVTSNDVPRPRINLSFNGDDVTFKNKLTELPE